MQTFGFNHYVSHLLLGSSLLSYIKGALCSFSKNILIRRERSLTFFKYLNKPYKQTLYFQNWINKLTCFCALKPFCLNSSALTWRSLYRNQEYQLRLPEKAQRYFITHMHSWRTVLSCRITSDWTSGMYRPECQEKVCETAGSKGIQCVEHCTDFTKMFILKSSSHSHRYSLKHTACWQIECAEVCSFTASSIFMLSLMYIIKLLTEEIWTMTAGITKRREGVYCSRSSTAGLHLRPLL